MESSSYFFRREPCPFCDQSPLIFVSCRSCGSILAWCGEQDHAVGVYDGKDLRDLGLGDTKNWARENCPVCRSAEMGYSSGEEIKRLGFQSAEVILCRSRGGDYVEDPEF